MKRIILLSLLPLMACNPCKRLMKYCPPSTDSVYIETVKLDTITVYTEADTMTLIVPVPCPDFQALESNTESSTSVDIKNKVLTVRTICKEDSLEIVIKELEKKQTQTIIKEVKVEVPVRYVPKVFKWSFVILIVLVLLSALWIYLKIKNIALKQLITKK